MLQKVSRIISVCVVSHLLIAGEVSYDETTKITGGSVTTMMKFAGAFSKDARKLGQPVVATVAVKGNQMLRSTQDYADITDLDARTITHIDKLKHEYSVTTFDQMKQAVQRAMDKAKSEPATTAASPQSAPAKDPNVQLGFEAHVRKTGATKQVSGLDTSEAILTLAMTGTDKSTGQQGAMAVTNDMWMAAEIPAYAEVREFERKFALEMGSTFTTGPDFSKLVTQAQSSDALKAMAKEMSQLQGVPVLQVMRMGMTADGKPLPAASEAPLPKDADGPSFGDAVSAQATQTAQQTASEQASQRVKGALGSSLGSAIGGFGGFGRKKKQPAPTETPVSASSSPQSAVLIESVTELGNFSSHVDSTLFAPPAGFKLVTSPTAK